MPDDTHTENSGGTGKPPPADHLGTSVTTWRGNLPTDQLPALQTALRGRVRPAQWSLVADVRDGEATVLLTLHVYWHQPSHRSVATHVSQVRRDLIGRLESKTDAHFGSESLNHQFIYA
jgi:hypothetical protein